jgi:hypothetical protein
LLEEVGELLEEVGVPCTNFLRGDLTPTRRRASARSSLFRLRYFLALAVSFEDEEEEKEEKEEEEEAAGALPCPAGKELAAVTSRVLAAGGGAVVATGAA